MSRIRPIATGTAVMAALMLVVAAVSGGVAASAAVQPSSAVDDPAAVPSASNANVQQADSENESIDPADQIYVEEDGDAVLVYTEEASFDPPQRTEVGVDVTRGLMHALVVDDLDEPTNATGDLQFVMTPDEVTGNGSLTAQRPDSIESMTLDLVARQTESTSTFDATYDAVYNPSRGGISSSLSSMTTSGSITAGGSTFATQGSADVTLATAFGGDQNQTFHIVENEGSYTIDARQKYPVSSFSEDRWSSREKARQALQSQYGSLALQLGGQSTVTLESYSFTDGPSGQKVLDVEYTVEYSGIDQGVSQQVATFLASSPQYNLTSSEAQAIGQQVADVNMDRVSASYVKTGGNVTADWDVQISNFDKLVFATLDLSSSLEEQDVAMQEQFERTRQTFEAQRAANFEQTITWSADVTADTQTEVSAEVHSSTQNYEAYVQELKDRDIPVGSQNIEVHAETQGDTIEATMTARIQQEALVKQSIDSFASSVGTDAESAQARAALEAFQSAQFQKARMNVRLDDDNLTVRAGASFDNLSALRDALSESTGDLSIRSVYAASQGGPTETYVRVNGLVASGATEADVRATAAADNETNISMPGNWSREFPAMDGQAAADYLGVSYDASAGDGGDGGDGGTTTTTNETTTAAGDGGSGDGGSDGGDGGDGGSGDGGSGGDSNGGGQPGFGVGASLAALLAALVLLARRQR